MDDIVFEIIIVATVLWGLNSGSTDAMHFSYGFRSSKVVVTSIWIWHDNGKPDLLRCSAFDCGSVVRFRLLGSPQ